MYKNKLFTFVSYSLFLEPKPTSVGFNTIKEILKEKKLPQYGYRFYYWILQTEKTFWQINYRREQYVQVWRRGDSNTLFNQLRTDNSKEEQLTFYVSGIKFNDKNSRFRRRLLWSGTSISVADVLITILDLAKER